MVALRDDYQDLGFPVAPSSSMREPLSARPQAWLEVEEQAQDVIFRVKDDGPGIPEELLERVLGPTFGT